MSHAASDDLASVNAEDGDHHQRVSILSEASKLSKPPELSSNPCKEPAARSQQLHEHVVDSGYGSASSTPDRQDTATPTRKPSQIPLIRQAGLYVSNKAIEPQAKQRFREVQLQIEKMLLEFIRRLKSIQGRQKPIAIRSMMLGKTEADTDARAYMVVICPENIKSKLQGFFDEPLVKSLCEPGDDDIPSFKVLVIGHALRLRASTSDIRIQYGSMNHRFNGKKTFCGMPIRVSDNFGHSRNATFGGVVKVTSSDGAYELYGLTAGHMIQENRVVADDDDPILDTLYGVDLVHLDLTGDVQGAIEDSTGARVPKTNGNIRENDRDEWYFSATQDLGKVVSANKDDSLHDEQQGHIKPCLDWALFELNAYRPNRIGLHGRGQHGGDLCLKSPVTHDSRENVFVQMLCASQGIKHGVLSTTHARVLLDPGDNFTDAYTLSLEDSQVSDGDSGSWVVEESRLEVYGHVVADDIFGDAYVIPMDDILADIRRYLGASSVELPTGLDFISQATQKQPMVLAEPDSVGTRSSQHATATSGNTSRPTDEDERSPTRGERPIRELAARSSATVEFIDLHSKTWTSNLRAPNNTISDARRKNVRFDDDASHSGSSSSSSSAWSKSSASSSSTYSKSSEPASLGHIGEPVSEQEALRQAIHATAEQVEDWKEKALLVENQFTKRLRHADLELHAAKNRCAFLENDIIGLQHQKRELRDANETLEARIKALQDEDTYEVQIKADNPNKQPPGKAQIITTPLSKSDKLSARLPPVRIKQGPSIRPSQTERPPHTNTVSIEQVLNEVTIPGTQKHKKSRRRYEDIEHLYKCGWNGCEKTYATLNHLNAHVIMQSHGDKPLLEDLLSREGGRTTHDSDSGYISVEYSPDPSPEVLMEYEGPQGENTSISNESNAGGMGCAQ